MLRNHCSTHSFRVMCMDDREFHWIFHGHSSLVLFHDNNELSDSWNSVHIYELLVCCWCLSHWKFIVTTTSQFCTNKSNYQFKSLQTGGSRNGPSHILSGRKTNWNSLTFFNRISWLTSSFPYSLLVVASICLPRPLNRISVLNQISI